MKSRCKKSKIYIKTVVKINFLSLILDEKIVISMKICIFLNSRKSSQTLKIVRLKAIKSIFWQKLMRFPKT